MREFDKSFRETVTLPHPGDYRTETVEAWFANEAREYAAGLHAGFDQAQIKAYYVEARSWRYIKSGLLRGWRRPFFRRHFAETLSRALAFLFGDTKTPTILDLGCGTGTQALLLALHGAKVVAADLDPVALRVFRRRLELYQELCGRTLSVTIIKANTFELDYGEYGPFDGVYSLFAFNMMQPSEKLVDILLPHLAVGARWAVLDGNNICVWTKLLASRRRRVWSPLDMARELKSRGFKVISQQGGVALPPPMWALAPYCAVRSLDQSLCNSMFWPISCQTLAILER
jgi:SAM-dependent methyltransferase